MSGSGTMGIFYAVTGTFLAGVTYSLLMYVGQSNTGSTTGHVGIGSQGTPTDKAQSAALSLTNTFQSVVITWTPSADRTDVHIWAYGAASTQDLLVDGVQLTRRDSAASTDPSYSDVGPGGGGSFVTTRAISTTAKYGSSSQSLATPATATAGRIYDFNHIGAYFVSGETYTLSMWINPTSSMPYVVGLAANKADGTWDQATATGTASANAWTQVTVSWTPTADRSAASAWNVLALIYQTDATARTFLVDGVRVIPGASADNFEEPYWNIANTAESEVYVTAANLSGSAASALQQLNNLTLSRHWISATLTTPFYQYNIQDRKAYAVAASAESYADGTTALQMVTQPELDRQSIANTIGITDSTVGTVYYSDEPSVGTYAERPAQTISGASFYPDQTTPALVASAYLSRFAQPIRRPEITVENRFPSQLQRDVGDAVWVTVQPWFINLFASILRITTTVDSAGQHWQTKYQLEESMQPAGSAYAGAVLGMKPVGYWRLDEASGTVAVDQMSANNGTYVGSPTLGVAGLLTGDSDTAVSFNGTGQYVVFGGVDLESGDWTLSAVAVPSSVAAGWHTVFGASAGGVGLGFSGASFLATCSSVADAPLSGFNALAGQTCFICATYVKSTGLLSYYVNGALASSWTWTPGWIGGASTQTIAARGELSGLFSGTLDEPAVWDRALTAAEVLALYTAGTGH